MPVAVPVAAVGDRDDREAARPPPGQALGRRLRLLRVLSDLSAKDVARRAGLHAAQLGHIEAGRRPLRPAVALRLLQALGADPEGRDG